MDNRLFFPATKRNSHFIADVLSKVIDKNGYILEIGSGSGEHGVFFQKRFPEIIWQTSDPEILHRKSISSWINYEGLNKKMPEPLAIDVEKTPWRIPSVLALNLKGIISVNMIHIASWNCTKKLFEESGKWLQSSQFLMLYGPFKIRNKHISESNYLFDKSLKMQNNFWGVRNLEEVSDEAEKNGFYQKSIVKMPSNNFSVIFQKVS